MKWVVTFLLLPFLCTAQRVKLNAFDNFIKKQRIELEPVSLLSSPSTKLNVTFSAIAAELYVQVSGSGWGATTIDDGNELIFLFDNDSTVAAKSAGLQTFEPGLSKSTYRHQYRISFEGVRALATYNLTGVRKYSFKEFSDVRVPREFKTKLQKAAVLFLDELKKSNVIKVLKQINVRDIASYVGDSVQFCSRIYNTRYYEGSENKPTVLDVQSDFSDPLINVVIMDEDRRKFGDAPEKIYLNKDACITGVVTLRNNVPYIVARKREQIRIKSPATLETIGMFIGDSVSVSGKIFTARYLAESATAPTLLNMGAPFPNQPLTVVIEQQDRSQFEPNPEYYYLNKEISVTGKVVMFKGKPQIVVRNRSQIKVLSEGTAATTTSYEEPQPSFAAQRPVEKADKEAETPAQFPGGESAWSRFLQEHLKVPESMPEGEKKTVVASFYVNVDGTITDTRITKSAGRLYDDEVLRVLKLMPRWRPKSKGNFLMGVMVTQPVTFRRENKDETQTPASR